MKKIITIDFNGVLVRQHDFTEFIVEKPLGNAKETLDWLKEQGFKIIILTTRLNPSFGGDIAFKKRQLERWLKRYEIPFDEITNNKPGSDYFIDNKAICFTNWKKVKKQLKKSIK